MAKNKIVPQPIEENKQITKAEKPSKEDKANKKAEKAKKEKKAKKAAAPGTMARNGGLLRQN